MTVRVRAIGADELRAFSRISPEGAADVEAHVRATWQAGVGSPELCFVAEVNGELVGRVAYTRTAPEELGLFALWLPWGRDHVEVGRVLLGESLAAVHAAGVAVVEARVNVAFHSYAEEREDVFAAAGVERVQTKARLVGPTAAEPRRPSVELRTLDAVGRDAFVDALARVTEGTLDRLDALEVERLGPALHAEWYVRGLEGEGVEPTRWLLGYDGDELAALLVLQEWDEDTGTLAYIGVAPEHRGRGLGAELVAEARRRLAADGLQKMLADVDLDNGPMLAALERAGMERRAELRVYWARLRRVSH